MEQQFAAINQQCKKIIFDNCRNIADNCCSQKQRLELRHCAASGARNHKLSDAQYIQRDLLPINLHTRCL